MDREAWFKNRLDEFLELLDRSTVLCRGVQLPGFDWITSTDPLAEEFRLLSFVLTAWPTECATPWGMLIPTFEAIEARMVLRKQGV
jgi:hypothetical protein